MEVVAHHGVGQHIDSEDGGESFHASANPLAAERKIFARDGINAGKKSSPNAALDSMNDSDFVRNELIGPSRPTHETPPRNGKIAELNHFARPNASKKWVALIGRWVALIGRCDSLSLAA
jgi:hypothetical protein